jgi:signal transduction histidine kinase
VLTERGLAPALEGVAARSTVPVELTALPEDRLPEPIEAAVYYVVCEALVNVAKHANASGARVSVAQNDGQIVVEVSDDGDGGADVAQGSGLRGLADRVEALDGRLVLMSEASGTTLRAAIPLR